MIDPLARRDQGASLFGFGFGLSPGGAAIPLAPVALAAFLHRGALQRADRAHAVGHLPAPARRSIWARISSI
ncbi:hypothetical protein D3C72_1957520 [compost metagenome]